MEELKNLLTEFVSRTLKMDATAVTSALFEQEGDTLKVKPDALQFLTGKDAERIRVMSESATDKFQQGYQKAKKEERSIFEKEIRDQTGITSDAVGMDLINEVIASKTKVAEITDEVIQKHPSFIKKEKELIKAKEDAVNEILAKQKSERNMGIFTTKSLEHLDALNPVLPEDANIAKNQKELFKMVLQNENYEVSDTGEIVFLNADKTRMNDQHGHPVEFKERIKTLASNYFQFRAADDRSAGGDPNKKGGAGTGGAGSIKKPATRNEFLQQMDALSKDKTLDFKDRVAKQNELVELSKDLV